MTITFEKMPAPGDNIKLKSCQRIFIDASSCGFYGRNRENQYEIWLYLEWTEEPGYRPQALMQTTPTESQCREWISANIKMILESSLKLHFIPRVD